MSEVRQPSATRIRLIEALAKTDLHPTNWVEVATKLEAYIYPPRDYPRHYPTVTVGPVG